MFSAPAPDCSIVPTYAFTRDKEARGYRVQVERYSLYFPLEKGQSSRRLLVRSLFQNLLTDQDAHDLQQVLTEQMILLRFVVQKFMSVLNPRR